MSDEIESTDVGIQGDEITNEVAELKISERDRINAVREAEILAEAGETLDSHIEEEKSDIIESKPLTVKVKIDGIEEEKNVDDIVKDYQKYAAGDRRLQQAAHERQLLDQERQQLDVDRLALTEQLKKQEINETLPIDELRIARREALEIGDYDEFDRLDEEIARQRDKPVQQFNIDDVINQASTRLEYKTALSEFEKENSRIVNDNVLYNIAMSTFNNMCQESSTYSEAFKKTEKFMNEWIASVAPANKQQVDTAMTDRIDKKNAIPNEPGRLNVRSAPPPAQKEETASDIILNMRKARGLPV